MWAALTQNLFGPHVISNFIWKAQVKVIEVSMIKFLRLSRTLNKKSWFGVVFELFWANAAFFFRWVDWFVSKEDNFSVWLKAWACQVCKAFLISSVILPDASLCLVLALCNIDVQVVFVGTFKPIIVDFHITNCSLAGEKFFEFHSVKNVS